MTTKVLFVDDDENILSGLRRMLHGQRGVWSMEFIGDPLQAAERVADGSFDVVVSDMRMPHLDGAGLLSKVKEVSPRTIRIILSGQSEVSASIRSVPVAHRFLNKPCDPKALQDAITNSIALENRLNAPEIAAYAGSIDVLPSLSTTVLRLNEILADPDSSVHDVVEIVEHDTALTAKVLHLVNSAFFGLSRDVSRIDEAVSYLGVTTVRNVAAAVEIARAFEPTTEYCLAIVSELQGHALRVGDVAKSLVPKMNANEALVAGLLHDVGLLALMHSMPERCNELVARAREAGSVVEVEKEVLGIGHADFGAYLLTLWGLPYQLIEAVALHHEPSVLERGDDDLARAVYIAEQTVNAEDDRSAGIPE